MLSWINNSSTSARPSSLCGYLWKMKREKKVLIPQWNKRWFSIEGRKLRWYKSQNDDTFSGEIDLRDVTDISELQSDVGIYSFTIDSSDRDLVLRAVSKNDSEKWVRALILQADTARGGNGTCIISKAKKSSSKNSQKASRTAGTSPTIVGGIGTNLFKKSTTFEAQLDVTLKEIEKLEQQYRDGKFINENMNDLKSNFGEKRRESISSIDSSTSNVNIRNPDYSKGATPLPPSSSNSPSLSQRMSNSKPLLSSSSPLRLSADGKVVKKDKDRDVKEKEKEKDIDTRDSKHYIRDSSPSPTRSSIESKQNIKNNNNNNSNSRRDREQPSETSLHLNHLNRIKQRDRDRDRDSIATMANSDSGDADSRESSYRSRNADHDEIELIENIAYEQVPRRHRPPTLSRSIVANSQKTRNSLSNNNNSKRNSTSNADIVGTGDIDANEFEDDIPVEILDFNDNTSTSVTSLRRGNGVGIASSTSSKDSNSRRSNGTSSSRKSSGGAGPEMAWSGR